MISDTATAAAPKAAQSFRGLSLRIQRSVKAQAEDWYDVCRDLSLWEERELVDNAHPANLAEHAEYLDELEEIGKWLQDTLRTRNLRDPNLAGLISAALQDLRDRRALWHGRLSKAEGDQILKDIFNEP